MTATIVNGYHVVSDIPARSPLPHPTDSDKALYFKTIRALSLSNGEVVYGCVDCTYTADTTFKVRAHRSHHPRTKGRGGGANGVRAGAHRAPDTITIDDLVSRLTALAKMEGERDRWRTRAIAAERKLAALGRHLTEMVHK
jgi:hypothetical protein